MRMLTEHKVNPVNDLVDIKVIVAEGGEPVTCQLTIPNGTKTVLNFQHGPINEVGVNGITNEALLVIVADRLRYFQRTQFTCRENALAITKVEEALHWLHARTRRRVSEGTEGSNKLPG